MLQMRRNVCEAYSLEKAGTSTALNEYILNDDGFPSFCVNLVHGLYHILDDDNRPPSYVDLVEHMRKDFGIDLLGKPSVVIVGYNKNIRERIIWCNKEALVAVAAWLLMKNAVNTGDSSSKAIEDTQYFHMLPFCGPDSATEFYQTDQHGIMTYWIHDICRQLDEANGILTVPVDTQP